MSVRDDSPSMVIGSQSSFDQSFKSFEREFSTGTYDNSQDDDQDEPQLDDDDDDEDKKEVAETSIHNPRSIIRQVISSSEEISIE